jgi:hypothetical protein
MMAGVPMRAGARVVAAGDSMNSRDTLEARQIGFPRENHEVAAAFLYWRDRRMRRDELEPVADDADAPCSTITGSAATRGRHYYRHRFQPVGGKHAGRLTCDLCEHGFAST